MFQEGPQECDFEGCSIAPPQEPTDISPLATCFRSDGDLEQHLVFTGLEGASPCLTYLTTVVHFSIGPAHKLERTAGPMQVGQDGRVYAAVQYPSIRDLWAEIYHNTCVRVVQVDIAVQVRSGHTVINYPNTERKVTYRRSSSPADNVVLWRPQDQTHTIVRRPGRPGV